MKQKNSLVMLVNAMEPRGKALRESWRTKLFLCLGVRVSVTQEATCDPEVERDLNMQT